jgi:hypothetical protein
MLLQNLVQVGLVEGARCLARRIWLVHRRRWRSIEDLQENRSDYYFKALNRPSRSLPPIRVLLNLAIGYRFSTRSTLRVRPCVGLGMSEPAPTKIVHSGDIGNTASLLSSSSNQEARVRHIAELKAG